MLDCKNVHNCNQLYPMINAVIKMRGKKGDGFYKGRLARKPSCAAFFPSRKHLLIFYHLFIYHLSIYPPSVYLSRLFVCVWAGVCRGTHMEVRGQLAGISSLLLPCEFKLSDLVTSAFIY